MPGRSKQADVGGAAEHLREALSTLATATGRWAVLQPRSRGVEASGRRLRERSGDVAEDLSAWTSNTAHEIGDAARRARRRTRRMIVDVVVVVLLGYCLDRLLSDSQ